MTRAAWSVLFLGVAIGLGWIFYDSFVNPTFFGDQGTRLDNATALVVHCGKRVWLPLLQFHIYLLYLARVPPSAFLFVPYAYALLTLWLVALLCRAAVPNDIEALILGALLFTACAGSSMQWLGRSLYQESLVIPLFLALVYLHHFAPTRRWLFVAVFALGMLTREVFWIWWAVFLLVAWRGQLRDARFRIAMLGLGVIPAVWLLMTHQPPLLARNVEPQPQMIDATLEHGWALMRNVIDRSFLSVLIILTLTFASLLAIRGRRGISFREYHLFSLLSLAAMYGYIVLFTDKGTAHNTRELAPLYAHVLVWSIIAWREVRRLSWRAAMCGRVAVAVAVLSMLQVAAIFAALGQGPRTDQAWEPVHVARSLSARENWRADAQHALHDVRAGRNAPVRVTFVDLSRREYNKFWLAPFLYETRTRAESTAPLAGDIVVAPEGFERPGWTRLARLHVRRDLVRDLLTPAPPAS